MNADMVCHTLKFCKQDKGQPLCHLYPSPKEASTLTLEKAKQIVLKSQTLKYLKGTSDICSFPFLTKICQKIKLYVYFSTLLSTGINTIFSFLCFLIIKMVFIFKWYHPEEERFFLIKLGVVQKLKDNLD